jgi:PleD family two-component response regulator
MSIGKRLKKGSLLKRVDNALHLAGKQGRNRVETLPDKKSGLREA